MIPVTVPFLPEKSEYLKLLDDIWERNWLTNNGPLVRDFEKQLKLYLKTPELLYVGNGTIALQLAIKALALKGEIITTPFSYVATTSSIVWENCKPVFVDICSETFNIDPTLIRSAITKETSAILATHCFGNPCDIEEIQQIAKDYDLKIIYDGAHCFGTLYKNESVFNFGDISTTSFHATKLMHSVEGGAVFSADPYIIERLGRMRNFGHDGPERFNGIGINGKNSEVHAAMGLCVLSRISEILSKRREQSMRYDQLLAGFPVRKQLINPYCSYNFAYYPIVFQNEDSCLAAKENLERNGIYPRRYFYPSLSKLDYTNSFDMPISEAISSSILCLPVYHALSDKDQIRIADILLNG